MRNRTPRCRTTSWLDLRYRIKMSKALMSTPRTKDSIDNAHVVADGSFSKRGARSGGIIVEPYTLSISKLN
jgi:hypothetical protein